MEQPRVMYVSPVWFFKGEAERCLFEILENPLVEQVLVVPRFGPLSEHARDLGIAVETIDFGSVEGLHRPFSILKGLRALSDALGAARQLKALAREHNVDVLHSNGLKAHAITVMAGRLGGPSNVVHIHDIAYTRQEKLVWRLLSALATRAVFVSKACWPFKQLPKNGVIIFNAAIVPENAVALPRRSSSLVLGAIGRIHPHKGHHNLLRWIGAARRAGFDVRLRIRGSYSSETPGYENQINTIIAEENLQDYVQFDGFAEGMEKTYGGLDAVCTVSEAPEPFGRTVLEPMSLGIPVIGTPAGGITELIIDRVTGFMVTDAQSFTDAIATLMDQPELVDRMIDAGRNYVDEKFSMEKMHKSVRSLYDDIKHPMKAARQESLSAN